MIGTILIVDDCSTTRKIIDLYLKGAGYNTITAANGVEAIEKLVTAKVDFIITDLNMPQMDGIELLSWVRNNAPFKGLPFVILTTEQDGVSRAKGLGAGASGFLSKPITRETLIRQIREIADVSKGENYVRS